MTDTVLVPRDELAALARAALEAVAVPREDAANAADILVMGDLMGIHTHGTRRLITYIQRIRDGAIRATPNITVDSRAPSLAIVDGDNGLGPVVGSHGVATAIRLARETGIAYVGCRRSHHFGPVMPYALRACEAGMICIMGTNAQPVMAPWRGKQVAHGNNPIAIGAPRGDGVAPFLLDIALSIVAYSKLRDAHEAGRDIPPGWAADGDGKPTTDPVAGMRGWVQPIGDHKGYGLALAVDLFASVLIGGAFGTDIESLYKRDDRPQGVGHFFIVIDPARTIGRDAFLRQMDAFCAMMKAVTPIDPDAPVLIPGEPEWRSIAEKTADGVPMPRARYEEIRGLARGEPPRSMPEQ